MNDGDWVESCTALVEHHDGRFEIITWTSDPDEAPAAGN
jgi:UDP-2,3-diacylglucosamine pyrophosphatase LpxH